MQQIVFSFYLHTMVREEQNECIVFGEAIEDILPCVIKGRPLQIESSSHLKSDLTQLSNHPLRIVDVILELLINRQIVIRSNPDDERDSFVLCCLHQGHRRKSTEQQ